MKSLTHEQVQKLIEVYPYLLPRNSWTGDVSKDYDYSYVRGQHELPDGWLRLFFLYCKAIRPVLADNNYLDKFRFSTIKEKFGSMRLSNFGFPAAMRDLDYMYYSYSHLVCQRCGRIAKYRTLGWIEQLCENCYVPGKQEVEHVIPYGATYIEHSGSDGQWLCVLPLLDVDTEYKKCLSMTDSEFFDYITAEENYAGKEHPKTGTKEP